MLNFEIINNLIKIIWDYNLIILYWIVFNLIMFLFSKTKKTKILIFSIIPYLIWIIILIFLFFQILFIKNLFKKVKTKFKEIDKKFTNYFEKIKKDRLTIAYEASLEKKEKPKKKFLENFSNEFFIIILIILAAFALFKWITWFLYENQVEKVQNEYKDQMTIDWFYKDFKEGKINIVKIWIYDYNNNHFQAILKKEKGFEKVKTINVFKLPNEKWTKYEKELEEMKNFTWLWTYKAFSIDWLKIIPWVLYWLFFVFFWTMLYKQMKMGSWDTDKKIKKFDWIAWNKVSFKDIGWIESIKNDIQDIVKTLKNWENFQTRGVRLLRWILFHWPAGVWKTMIAKAIASELWIEMFIATWNDFRWKYLWQWADKVHSTFKRIKEDMHDKFSKIRKEIGGKWNKLSILFIDEIDTVFRKRWTWHSEDDTVVNAFLHEMDWIEGDTNIIVIWATNHLEKLDDALLSRIDKKIAFKLPTRKERLDIATKIINWLKIKDKIIKIKDKLNLNVFSANTLWLWGRDIDNILNEIHRKSIMENKTIDESFIQEWFSDYILWKDNTWIDVNWKDKEVVTYHELWHWVIWFLNWKTVHTITIIPKGPALGLTWSIDKDEKVLRTPEYILKEIQWLVAWRLAEKIWMWEITTWSSNDYERATQLAFSYFKDYNFKYKNFQLWYIINKNNNDNQLIDVEVHKELEKQVNQLIKDQEENVEKRLLENKNEINKLAEILKDKEIIEEKDLIKYLK